MGLVTKLSRSPSPPDDPLREALRRAIDAHAHAMKERDRIASVLEKAQERCFRFFDEIDKIASEVNTLVDTRSERIAARILDGKDLVDHELKDAQKRLADTEEAQIAAQDAHKVLEASCENAENILRSAKEKLENAAAAILLTKAGQIEDRIRSLLTELSPLFAQLAYMQQIDHANVYPTDDHRQRASLLSDPLRVVPCYGKYLSDPIVTPAVDPLKQAFNALMADANASVPEV